MTRPGRTTDNMWATSAAAENGSGRSLDDEASESLLCTGNDVATSAGTAPPSTVAIPDRRHRTVRTAAERSGRGEEHPTFTGRYHARCARLRKAAQGSARRVGLATRRRNVPQRPAAIPGRTTRGNVQDLLRPRHAGDRGGAGRRTVLRTGIVQPGCGRPSSVGVWPAPASVHLCLGRGGEQLGDTWGVTRKSCAAQRPERLQSIRQAELVEGTADAHHTVALVAREKEQVLGTTQGATLVRGRARRPRRQPKPPSGPKKAPMPGPKGGSRAPECGGRPPAPE